MIIPNNLHFLLGNLYDAIGHMTSVEGSHDISFLYEQTTHKFFDTASQINYSGCDMHVRSASLPILSKQDNESIILLHKDQRM